MLTVAGFALFPRFPHNILDWLDALRGYSGVQPAAAPYPSNLGIGRSLISLLDMTGVSQLLGADGRAFAASWLDVHGTAINLFALAVTAMVLWFTGRRLPVAWTFGLATFMVLYSSSTVYFYYLCLVLPLAALVVRDPLAAPDAVGPSGTLDREHGTSSDRVAHGVLVTVLALAMAPIVVPPDLLGERLNAFWQLYGVSGVHQTWTGPVLLVGFGTLLVAAIVKALAGDPDDTPDEPPDGTREDAPDVGLPTTAVSRGER